MELNDNKGRIAQQIKAGAKVYSRLVGQTYLIVYNNTYVEIMFKTANFKHLTGVGTNLSAEDFYRNAVNNTLMGSQLYFTPYHSYRVCKKKIQCINSIDSLLRNDSIIVEDVITDNGRWFKIGLTELNFTICFSDNCNVNGNKIDDILVPHSLRVKDDAFNLSKSQYIVENVFSKPNNSKKYTQHIFGDSSSISLMSDNIKDLICV